MFRDLSGFYEWFDELRERNEYEVTATALDSMEGWRIDPDSGNITHRSGKFFSVQGVDVNTDHRDVRSWAQPIIVQPEIGVLGMLVKVVKGTVYCLMQAKMEPGNINLFQLSPTVQATRSNYTKVHEGKGIPYLEYFAAPRSGRVVFDALQSEQGSWFLDKRNRNMIVEETEDVQLLEGFCWLSLEQISALLRVPNLVNMCARAVLSGMPFFVELPGIPGSTLHSMEHLLSWFTEMRSAYQLSRRLMPLSDVSHWVRSCGRVVHEAERHFSVTGVHVRATSREVTEWSQPLLKPAARGVIAFLGRHIDRTFHVLVHARTEAGTHDVVEMAPTVTCIPANYAGLPSALRPRYLDEIDRHLASSVLVDVIHSEEGGRFLHAENRYLVIDMGERFDLDVPDDYCWMTVNQLTSFVRYGNYVNVAARSLLSCLTVGSAPRAPGVHPDYLKDLQVCSGVVWKLQVHGTLGEHHAC